MKIVVVNDAEGEIQSIEVERMASVFAYVSGEIVSVTFKDGNGNIFETDWDIELSVKEARALGAALSVCASN